MVVVSKLLLNRIRHTKCDTLVHPGTSCWRNALSFYQAAAEGAVKFYAPIYLIPLLLRWKSLTREELWKAVYKFLRSVTVLIIVIGNAVVFHCLTRQIVGSYKQNTFLFIPVGLAGLSYGFEEENQRKVGLFTAINVVLETVLLNLKLTTSMQTAVFMLANASLMYLIRQTNGSCFWIFKPDPPTNTMCLHIETCTNKTVKGALQYFCYGSLVGVLRNILFHIKKPKVLLQKLVQVRTYKMGIFAGCYIGIYQAVSCFLAQYHGKDSSLHAIPAGFLAGLSFLIKPNSTICITPITCVLQTFPDLSKAAFGVNNIPQNSTKEIF